MIWNGRFSRDSFFDRVLYHTLHHDRSWVGDLVRSAFGFRQYADPRKNVRSTKKYADGRQKNHG